MIFNHFAKKVSVYLEALEEESAMRKLAHINLTLIQAKELAKSLDSSFVTESFKVSLLEDLKRIQFNNDQRAKLIQRRVQQRIRGAKVLAVDFSREKV